MRIRWSLILPAAALAAVAGIAAAHHSFTATYFEDRTMEIEGKDKSLNTMLSLATSIEPAWLRELFPEDIVGDTRVSYDATSKRVYAEEQLRFRDLALSGRKVEPPPADEAARLLAEEVMQGRLVLKQWDHAVDQWVLRLNLLSRWCPELQLPPITEADRRHLVEQLCHGAVSFKDLKDREVKPLVQSWLSAAQRELLERHAPERLELPNGRRPKVTYEPGGQPFIALRIQELYDVPATPRVAMGRVRARRRAGRPSGAADRHK